jgi:hypothetical protein
MNRIAIAAAIAATTLTIAHGARAGDYETEIRVCWFVTVSRTPVTEAKNAVFAWWRHATDPLSRNARACR